MLTHKTVAVTRKANMTIANKYAFLIIFCTSTIIGNTKDRTDQGIQLSSPVLKTIDGVRGLVDEHTIHKTIYIGQAVMKFMHGNVDPKTKKRIPQHAFNNQLYTLKQLVTLEQRAIKNNNKQLLQKLGQAIKKIRVNFQKITDPFLKEARGTKQQMIELIKESCTRRNRINSALLTWSDAHEHDTFNSSITNFGQLYIFCVDLTNFLKDFIKSCPKAHGRFIKWKKNQLPKKTALNDTKNYWDN